MVLLHPVPSGIENLLTDISLSYLSEIIEGGMCPELRAIDLSRFASLLDSPLVNYINRTTSLCFNEFCSQHSITLTDGGHPNFSLSSTIPLTQPPVLIYRVISKMEAQDQSCYHYSDFATMGKWCADDGRPIIGVQLFYYGRGNITARLRNARDEECCGNGDCGDLIVSTGMLPVTSVEFGYKDVPFSGVGMTNAANGVVVELRVCLVANP